MGLNMLLGFIKSDVVTLKYLTVNRTALYSTGPDQCK